MAIIKTPREIDLMREGGIRLARVTERLKKEVGEGVTLRSLDARARILMKEEGCTPAFLGYQPYGASRPFPAAVCTSLNNVVVHGTPTEYALRSGDILKLDLGVRYKEYYTDTAFTCPIGRVDENTMRLVQVTHEALVRGIAAAKHRNTLGDIGYAVATHVKRRGFHVIQGLTGHGIGKALHEEPSVLNEGKPGEGMRLRAGMVLAIEVMTGLTSAHIVQREDESYATADGSPSAHFEHTVAVTEAAPRILTVL